MKVGPLMRYPRIFPLVLIGLSYGAACLGQATIVTDDRVFSGIPFEKWLADGDQGKFHWSVRVTAGELSNHQRLKSRVDLQVDGNDVAARRGHGYLIMLVQFEDSDHRLYRSHGTLDLQEVTESAAKSDVVYTQEAFLRPGEYQVSLLIFDTKNGDHSALQRKVRANPIKNDPFPSAWEQLPAVEFTGSVDAPDSWYLPLVSGKLKLGLATRRPVRIEVLVNASPTAAGAGARTGQVNHRSLAELIPAAKVLTEVKLEKGTMGVSLLDLTRQSVLFEQNTTGDLDWPQLRAALIEADPNKIDAKALAHRRGNAQFFIAQMKQRLHLEGESANAEDPVRIGIVLSGPMSFDSGEDRHPIEGVNALNGRLFYVRYHALVPQQREQSVPEPLRIGRRGVAAAPTSLNIVPQEPLDGLVNLIKPLQPRVFDVYTPDQFRKTLSSILEEIARL